MRRLAAGYALAGMVLTAGCSDEPERPDCIVLSACQSLFATVTYQVLFDNIFQPKCGTARNCHGPGPSPKGGLAFTDIDQSYDLLLGNIGGKARVKPFNAECSELVVRTSDVGQDWTMPPGTALPSGESCAIRQWVDAGATR